MSSNKTNKIYCTNTQNEKEYPFGTSLHEIIQDQQIDIGHPILGAMVNNNLKELDYCIYKPKNIRFIDYTHPDGKRMYLRSLSFVLYMAAYELFPEHQLKIEHSVSNGFYCTLQGDKNKLNYKEAAEKLQKRMEEIIAQDLPFEREELRTEEAIELFEKYGLHDKSLLVQTRRQFYSSVYKLNGVINYFYGYLVPSSGYLQQFKIQTYHEGLLLLPPKQSDPEQIEDIIEQDKLFEIFREFKDWVKIMDVPNIGALNMATMNMDISRIIKVSEALQEKKIACIAELIEAQKDKLKVVLISGPSSSGKTTFAKRLSVQLSVIGFKPLVLSMDNYFVNRDKTPKDKNGDYDFESPYAIDIELFNKNMLDLFDGNRIDLPQFSFSTGNRSYNSTTLQLEKNSIILVEGIHGLNPMMSAMIPKDKKFKIYVSALTPLSMDSSNRIPTTDNRLIRRMVRDYQHRGYSALDTLKRWDSVRAGENEHIFPFQEEADVMFNTALLYELGVLKDKAEPILRAVPPIVPEYAEARRLLKFLSYITPIDGSEIPPTSILREFLDGSSFQY
ncbi:MAG: AAA family ATPase [Bacteroidetes bacterium 4572_77]|nr:MAG: AAA family ATPase [Bacteroidetes bacterium 4572_77]